MPDPEPRPTEERRNSYGFLAAILLLLTLIAVGAFAVLMTRGGN